MQADVLIVQLCEFHDVGDTVHRFHAPSRALSRLPGVVAIDCDRYHHRAHALMEIAHVLVLTTFDWDMYPLMQRRRDAGRVTVFEANDYYYDLQPWNPLTARWMDRPQQDSFRQGLLYTDAVQTSSPALAQRWRQRTDRPVAVFPNQLDDVPPLGMPKARPLTIGWGGSPGHFGDWYAVAPVLERWLKARPDVHLAVMTNEFARPFLQLPADRYHFRPFGTLPQYFVFLAGVDIGLAPLQPTEYNRCRSDVKFLEYASRGVPGIYADLEPYRDSVADGQTGLLYRTEAELLNCLDRLADDAALRQRIGAQSHEYVSTQRRLDQHIGKRLEFYRSLSPASAMWQPQAIPQDIVNMAKCDGRYLQLTRGEPEKALAAAIEGATTPQNIQSLKQLGQSHPRYLPALQHLGRRLNDQNQSQAALEYLNRALSLDPHSAKTLSEISRAYYRLNHDAKACQILEDALTRNPCYHIGWQYLLVMLQRMRRPDAPRWAEKARQANPANFWLALLGIKLYVQKEAIVLLRELIDYHAPLLLAEEIPQATAAFSRAVAEITGPNLGDADCRALLQHACQAFPYSVILANLLGGSLHVAGDIAGSQAQYIRADTLRRAGRTWAAEYPREDGSIHFWQFAAHSTESEKK